MKTPSETKKRALIVKFGQIGDVIMAIPAARALYDEGFGIDWVCGRAVQPLLECYSWINPIAADDKKILHGSTLTRLRTIAALWKKLAGQRYDLSAVLYYDPRYKALTLPVRAARKVTLSHQSRRTSLISGRHHTDEYLRVLLGNDDIRKDQSLPPVRPDRLPGSPIQAKSQPRRIAVVPGGAGHLVRQTAQKDKSPAEPAAVRRWPIENYAALTDRLLANDCEIVLIGGPEDSWAKPHLQRPGVIDCIGSLSLPEVISVFDTCDAVISHDTGPLHLAGLSKAPLIGLFGPTNPSTYLPRRQGVTGIWGGQSMACRPCYDGRDFAPCPSNECMQQISVALVINELNSLLASCSQNISVPWQIVSAGGGYAGDLTRITLL